MTYVKTTLGLVCAVVLVGLSMQTTAATTPDLTSKRAASLEIMEIFTDFYKLDLLSDEGMGRVQHLLVTQDARQKAELKNLVLDEITISLERLASKDGLDAAMRHVLTSQAFVTWWETI